MRIYIYLILIIYLSYTIALENTKVNTLVAQEDEKELIFEGNLPKNNIIELDEDFIITKISWTKNGDYKYNYLLGVFEISNEESFMEGIPIGLILEKEELKETNDINLSSKISL